MLKPIRSVPVGYRLCQQTVTVYHREGLTRHVADKAFYEFKRTGALSDGEESAGCAFLLVLPGEADIVPGDKVMPGVGAEISTPAEWNWLTPANVPGLGVVETVTPRFWQGKVCHVEARGG